MPSAISPNPRAEHTTQDDLEQIDDYDAAVNDFLKDLPINNQSENNLTTANATKDIDEEVVIKRKRKPIPKLDAERLLSQNGIPRLRKISKSRLKFRGKGHEFSDMSNLLNVYQLWLDDLFPKAKFRDGLDLIEKVGHTKRMQVMRKAWLDDTKPHRRDASPNVDEDFRMAGALVESETQGQPAGNAEVDGDEHISEVPGGEQAVAALDKTRSSSNTAPDDDDLDALLAESHSVDPTSETAVRNRRGPFDEDSDEDDLDALLAEQPSWRVGQESSHNISASIATRREDPADDNFADEEEVMAGMDMW